MYWLAIALCGLIVAQMASGAAGTDGSSDDNWLSHNGHDEDAYSTLRQINSINVDQLTLSSYLELPGEQMVQATPLAVNGTLYFTGSHAKVYAVDAVRGKLLWTYDPQIWKHNPSKLRTVLPANRGVAYAAGRIFLGTLDGRLLALDARSGKLAWSVETTDRQSVQYVTGAPRTFRDMVVIGNGGADFGARGYLTAYDAATGRLRWRFYIVPGSPQENADDPVMQHAAATWDGQYWKTGTGGDPWDGITFDAALNRIYVGTGNAAPYDPDMRSPGDGDNLFTASIVALEADTGKYLWHYQCNPRDAWDYDSSQQMALATLLIDAQPRKVLMQAPKNGFFYVLDRENGKLISAGKPAKVTWADHIDLATGRPVEAPNIRFQGGPITIYPAPNGAHNWQSMSYSLQSGLAYIPMLQMGMHYERTQETKDGTLSFAGLAMTRVVSGNGDGEGALVAWDPLTQTQRWRVKQSHLWNGGVLSTAGSLVFEGNAEGYFDAYDAYDGRRLWHFNAGLGITAAPITYAVRGKQYVSVLTGYGGTNMLGDVLNVGWKYDAQPRRLLTFALHGRATLPPSAPADVSVKALDDAQLQLNDADVRIGHTLFTGYCALCHGLDAKSAGAPAPDLRESAVAMSREALWQVLHEGLLLPDGMPRFDELTVEQVSQLYAYIRAQARAAASPH
jgi:quinohemoprotein ethanol dehydrogenase